MQCFIKFGGCGSSVGGFLELYILIHILLSFDIIYKPGHQIGNQQFVAGLGQGILKNKSRGDLPSLTTFNSRSPASWVMSGVVGFFSKMYRENLSYFVALRVTIFSISGIVSRANVDLSSQRSPPSRTYRVASAA